MKRPFSSLAPPLPGARHALFLDFDGSLVGLVDYPEPVHLPAQLPGLLAGLDRRLGGALAIVTERRIESLDEVLKPLRLRAAGLYGAQLRPDPADFISEARPLPGVADALTRHFAGDDSVRVEDKGATVALHYREDSVRAAALQSAIAGAIAHERLEIIAGKGVFEVCSHKHRKDLAVRALMAVEPFRNRIPVYAGDDAADEHGIREAQSWGGLGVKIGGGHSEAHWRLPDHAAVFLWLREMLWSLPDP